MRETTLRSVHAVVASSLDLPEDQEFERLLVAGSIVVRDGEHYRIEGLVESIEELERLAGRRCECGTPLSVRNGARICRRCYREFRR